MNDDELLARLEEALKRNETLSAQLQENTLRLKQSNYTAKRIRAVLASFAIASMVTLLVPLVISLARPEKRPIDVSSFLGLDAFSGDISKANRDIKSLRDAFDKSQSALSEMSKSSTPEGIRIAELGSEIERVSARLELIEESIGNNAEKALSVPLLRKDQDNLAKNQERQGLAVSVELARIYNQQQWMLGGIAIFLFAAISALASGQYKLWMKDRVE